jgi:Mrr N-terminal domain
MMVVMNIATNPARNTRIDIDNDVFAELQLRAVPLVDDVNSVLRRVLGLSISPELSATIANSDRTADLPARRLERKSAPRKKPSKGTIRAPKGSLLPEREYVQPLLASLVDRGGSAPSATLVEDLAGKLDGKLTPGDREEVSSGEVRWRNRVQFVRLGLIREGLMVRDSPRGIWEITDLGRNRVADLENGTSR